MFGTTLQVIAFGRPFASTGGTAARSAAASTGGRPGQGLKWIAILCFAAAPWVCCWSLVLALPEDTPDHVEKAELFQRRPCVDTVVVGDSRATRIAEGPFAARGWAYFNFALSGVSPEDMAMQLKYALIHGKIRRVVMGVSFEGMTSRFPFEFSRFHHTGPFAPAEICDFAAVDPGPKASAAGRPHARLVVSKDLLPLGRANLRLRFLVARLTGRCFPATRPNGTANYAILREQISSGNYDFQRQRDAKIYFRREDSEARYLERPQLAPHAKALYCKVFAALRRADISCVAFETPRTAEYQRMLDERPQLKRLQAEWRDFFRSQSWGRVKFVEAASTRDCCDENDFFDAVHFIGPTEDRLAERLAGELAALDRAAAPPGGRPAKSTASKDKSLAKPKLAEPFHD
jgi:hypothetical protein